MSEQISVQELVSKASEIMQELGIYKPYIKEWEKDQTITMYERYGGYYIGKYEQYPELLSKIREVEQQYGLMVYAVTHEYTSFGELYDLMYLSKNKEDAYYNKVDAAGNNSWYVPAYVLNISAEECSEFGDIIISALGGGLNRIG